MNFRLDKFIERICRNPEFRDELFREPEETAAKSSVAIEDAEAVRRSDLAALYSRGAHPLILMKLAATLKVDSRSAFGNLARGSDLDRPATE